MIMGVPKFMGSLNLRDTGKKVDPWSNFGRKKWTRGPLFSAKSGPSLPKAGPILSRKKCSFTAMSSTGPFLAREKSGLSPVSLPKSKQVHFWQGKKVDPVPFHCRHPGRSNFGKGKKWTRSSFTAEIQAGPILARGKSGPGPVSLPKSRQVPQGKKVDPVQFRC